MTGFRRPRALGIGIGRRNGRKAGALEKLGVEPVIRAAVVAVLVAAGLPEEDPRVAEDLDLFVGCARRHADLARAPLHAGDRVLDAWTERAIRLPCVDHREQHRECRGAEPFAGGLALQQSLGPAARDLVGGRQLRPWRGTGDLAHRSDREVHCAACPCRRVQPGGGSWIDRFREDGI